MIRAQLAPQQAPTPHSLPPTNQSISATASAMTTPPRSGTSSGVIQKLQTEIDRLRRELNSAKAQRDEAIQELRAAKNLIASISDQKETFSNAIDAANHSLARKDRKITDLRESIAAEKSRRQTAESSEAAMSKALDEVKTDAHQEVAEAKEQAKREEANAKVHVELYHGIKEIVSNMKDGWEDKITTLSDFETEHERKMMSLELVLEQERKLRENMERQMAAMSKEIAEFRDRESSVTNLIKEAQETLHLTKWSLSQQRVPVKKDSAMASDEEREDILTR